MPGLDSGDAFCRSWSEFAGSFQALGLVSAFGDPVDALRLEVIASPAVLAAVDGLDAALPGALADERSALVESYAGPFARRAAQRADELVRAGIEDPDRLGEIWLTQLAEQGVDDPALAVTLPPDVDPKAIESATEAFGAAVPSIVQDPSLITDVAIPATESYLAANCPDQGVLGGNDVVQS